MNMDDPFAYAYAHFGPADPDRTHNEEVPVDDEAPVERRTRGAVPAHRVMGSVDEHLHGRADCLGS